MVRFEACSYSCEIAVHVSLNTIVFLILHGDSRRLTPTKHNYICQQSFVIWGAPANFSTDASSVSGVPANISHHLRGLIARMLVGVP